MFCLVDRSPRECARKIHNHKEATKEVAFLNFLNANEPCCCDEHCEFVESVATGAIFKACRG
jgi:hypothetical protein